MKKNRHYLLAIISFSTLALNGCSFINRLTPSSSSNTSSGSSSSNSGSSSQTSSSQGDVSLKGISFSKSSFELTVGKSMMLTVTYDPENATDKVVSWASSNTSVLSVTDGVFKGESIGSATVTATSHDGGFTASCTVNVVEEGPEDTYVPEDKEEIYQITEAGEYNINQNYEQIYVNAPDADVVINLNGYTIENDYNSPIYVKDCGDLEISAKKNTVNYIKDMRSAYTEDKSDQGKGAIYVANGDLKLKGAGTLNITANYYNGIHCKDDVKIQKQTLTVTAINHAIRGNDSITVTSGTLTLSCGGDGLHSDNSDISSTGKQRGDVTINGGSLTINSYQDALSAAYNAVFEQTATDVPIIYTAKTNKYSSYDGETIDTSTSSFYIKMESTTYNNDGYTWAAYINNAWYKATYKGSQSSDQGGGDPWGGGMGRTYYFYEIEKPESATSFTLYRFSKGTTSFNKDSASAYSDVKAFNDEYDSIQISIRSGKINFGSWSNYSSGSSVSAKGIKANNEVYIKDGTLDIKAYDDAIHANNDNELENGASPLGNVNISGGTLALQSADDAVHADGTLNISGGETTVSTSYEGLEGNVINISGGTTYVYATDDGVNAKSGDKTPQINVTGGYLDVEVSTQGDTDGIDSNGLYTQSGGVVIVKGPGNAGGRTQGAAALDTDGAVTVNGGTLIVFGGIERTPTSSVTKTLVTSSTVSAGTKTISFTSESYTTTLKGSCGGCIVYSSLGTASLS